MSLTFTHLQAEIKDGRTRKYAKKKKKKKKLTAAAVPIIKYRDYVVIAKTRGTTLDAGDPRKHQVNLMRQSIMRNHVVTTGHAILKA